MQIGVIRVVTLEDAELKDFHGRLLEERFPLFATTSFCILDQPQGIHDESTKAQAIPKIVELGCSLAPHFDGLIISCADDEVIAEMQSKISIPVNGAGRPSALLGLYYGQRVGVLGLGEEPLPVFKEVLGRKLAAYAKPSEITSTMELNTERGRCAVIQAARHLQAHCNSLVLACTGMSTLMVAPFLAKETGLPVIDPVIAEGLFMYGQLLQQRQ